ncbi:VWA domain-containing protein [Mariniluteicoccus endophyticus]
MTLPVLLVGLTPLATQPSFGDPQRLWWLLVVPLLALAYLALGFRRARKPTSPLIRSVDRPWVRHVAVALALASLVSLTLAWARPRAETLVPRERATIAIVLDVSLSMEADDVPPNRLAAAKVGAKEFVDSLPSGFNVALVEFAGTANPVVPPTTDKGAVKAAIDRLQLRRSTAIGEGIWSALDTLAQMPPDPRDPKGKIPAVMVVLSDGESVVGRDPIAAAEESKSRGVPVHTIAYGTNHGYIQSGNSRTRVAVNTRQLRDIADAGGGTAYEAPSAEELRKTYQDIKRSAGNEKGYRDITGTFVGFGLVLGILASLGMISLGARWP